VIIGLQLPILHLYNELTMSVSLPHYENLDSPAKTRSAAIIRMATLISMLFKYFLFFVILFTVFWLFPDPLVVWAIGGFSSVVEGILPVPQLISNYRNRSVESLRSV